MEIRYYGDKISEHIAKTPEGFLICQDVPISRTGYQSYLASEIMENPKDGHKVIHVYRPASEVFNEKSLASFEGKPVCNEHPQEDITPENFHKFACGHVQNVHMGEGADSNKVLADLYITDPVLIRLIKDGKREISCGYYAEEKRDSAGRLCQTKIRGNHVAVVNSARAGKSVCIRDHKTTGKRNRLSLDGYDSPRHSLLSLDNNWLARLKPTRREMLMRGYYNSYFDDDEELESLEGDDILEEDIIGDDDELEDIEDDDILEEDIEDDEDELDELEDDDDVLEEDIVDDDDDELSDLEDDDELDEFEDGCYNDFNPVKALGKGIRSAGRVVGGTGHGIRGTIGRKMLHAGSAVGRAGHKAGEFVAKHAEGVKNFAKKAGKVAAGGLAAGAAAGALMRGSSPARDSWYYDDDIEEYEDAFYNDISLAGLREVAGKAGGAIKGAAGKVGGAVSGAAGKVGGAVSGAAGKVKTQGKRFAKAFKASGNSASPEALKKLGAPAKAGRALGKGVDTVRSAKGKALSAIKNNPLKSAAIAGGVGAGAGVLAGRASKDSWYPYYDGYYWDDDEELEGVDDIGVEDDDDIEEEDITIEQKADSILRDARRVLRDAKRKLYGKSRNDAIILSDDDDELEEEVEDDDDVLEEDFEDGCCGDNDGYGEDFDDDDEEPIDESDEIDVEKTQALRDITEATRGISDPHERKNVQDAVYGALCGRSQMADIMRATQNNRRARMDSLFGSSGQMSVTGQQAIYDSFNPHKN